MNIFEQLEAIAIEVVKDVDDLEVIKSFIAKAKATGWQPVVYERSSPQGVQSYISPPITDDQLAAGMTVTNTVVIANKNFIHTPPAPSVIIND